MRIAFITGCLEPGRDGVGDYVRTLAAECERRGHAVTLLSLTERSAVDPSQEEGSSVLRLSAAECEADGGEAARQWLDRFQPDWASLHFVPYSYHPRGFFDPWIARLKFMLSGAPRRHIFFHEIWIGFSADARWRERATGWWQRRMVGRLVDQLAPTVVHTSTGCYRALLGTRGINAGILPMIGSVPRSAEVRTGVPGALKAVAPDALVCGMFGTIHPNWEAETFLHDFAVLAAAQKRPAVLLAAGALRYGTKFFEQLRERWKGRVALGALGELPTSELPAVFARFDFAVSTMPWVLIGKSSSAAALREHGLRVVVTFAGSPPRAVNEANILEPADAGFVPFFRNRDLLPTALQKTLPTAGVTTMAEQFISDLTAASSGP